MSVLTRKILLIASRTRLTYSPRAQRRDFMLGREGVLHHCGISSEGKLLKGKKWCSLAFTEIMQHPVYQEYCKYY